MARIILALGLLVLGLGFAATPARAGDEDARQGKAKRESKSPEDTALPQAPETPELSMGPGEEPSPEFNEPGAGSGGAGGAQAQKRRRGAPKGWNRDENLDYTELLHRVDVADPRHGVLPPALGFRGYRPNMVAVGIGDRTPGAGVMVEYSWNRIGAGVLFAYRKAGREDRHAKAEGLAGLYGLYRWLPFDFSPYFLIGLEGGSFTRDFLGGMLGGGLEARVYSGLTLLVGWTFHSTTNRGGMGGAMGWSF